MNYTGMLKEGTLENKVILITGGGTGLGKSMGKYFMELGAHLIITSRKQDILDNTAEEFEAYSGKIFPVSADVRDSKDVKGVIQASLEKFGKVDVLVNNAGVYGPKGNIEKINWKEWIKALEINLFGSILLCKAVIPYFKKKK